MPLILISLVLVPVCISFSHILKQKAIHVLPLSLMVIIAFQYVMGLFGALSFGVWIIRLACVAAFAYVVYILATKKVNANKVAVDVLPIIIILLLMWWICRQRAFVGWDEFSHWGRAIKGLFYENVLPSISTLKDSYKEYPPAISLLQYSLSRTVI